MKRQALLALLFAAAAAVAQAYTVIEDIGYDYTSVRFLVLDTTVWGAGQTLKATVGIKEGETKITTSALTNSVTVTGLTAGEVYEYSIELDNVQINSGTIRMGSNNGKIEFDGTELTNAALTDGTIKASKLTPDDEETAMTVSNTMAKVSNLHVSLSMTVNFDYLQEDLPSIGDGQGAITLSSEGWKCWDPEVDGDDRWVAITNANVATTAGVYTVYSEYNYTNSASATVSYAIDSKANPMKTTAEKSEFELAGTPKTLNALDFIGNGSVSALEIEYWAMVPATEVTVVTNGDVQTIVITGNTAADLSKLAEGTYAVQQSGDGKLYNMTWTDSADKYAIIDSKGFVVKNGTPKNGLKSYDSYVLGLNAENKDSKPLLNSAQNADSNNLSFSVANIVPKTNLADVTCTLTELDAPDAKSGTKKGDFAPGATQTVDLPSTVKYYKLSIKVKAK